MKIRSGFVSNSSSSSFIVSGDKKTINVLDDMLDIWMGEPINRSDKDYKRIKKWINKNKDFDNNLLLPYTCNYETFIYKVDGEIYIDTCNNHEFYEIDYFQFIDEDDDDYGHLSYKDDTVKFLDVGDMKLKTNKEYWDGWCIKNEV